MKTFFKRRYINLVVFLATILTACLNKMITYLIFQKVLDQTLIKLKAPSLEPKPQTVTGTIFEPAAPRRPTISVPYVPTWVAASFKNAGKHPVLIGRGDYISKQIVANGDENKKV